MTNQLILKPSSCLVQSNIPFRLDTPNTLWIVTSGSMAIFAVRTVNGTLQSARRYLFEVKYGEPLFGIVSPLEGQFYTLVAIPYEPTNLLTISLNEWTPTATLNGHQPFPMLGLLQHWSDRLVGVFQDMGIPINLLPSASPTNAVELIDVIYQFHIDFLGCLHQLYQKETIEQAARFNNRQQLNTKATDQAVKYLTAVFRSEEAEFAEDGTPLLIALVAVGIVLINLIVTMSFAVISRRQLMKMSSMQGMQLGLEVQLINGVSKIRVAGAEQRAFAFWAKSYGASTQYSQGIQAIRNWVTLFNTVMSRISSIAIYWLAIDVLSSAQVGSQTAGGAAGVASVMSIGTFLAFNTAYGSFMHGASSLSNTLISLLDVPIRWKRALPILKELPEVSAGKADPGQLQGRVKLDRISFRYRQEGVLTLDKVTLEAEAGEFIAVVGPSGSGKSTLVRLLLGFETPFQGSVSYDGQDLSGLDVSAIRRQLGVVLQNGRINSASIFENISGGALVTMDEAWEASAMAGFLEDIEKMPMGMHTIVSEGGSNLSGGQRQRLLIARALVLKPKILIFDEATSALDNRTQAIVSESLDRLNVTRIVIAHRLSTIRNANRIYVLAAGRLVQQGTFDELIKQDGLFANLMARQIA
jgi:ABC-type multidrug transport system fused ATPase/permease subunit